MASLRKSWLTKKLGAAAIVLVLGARCASAYDWLQFGGDAQHSGRNVSETILAPANIGALAVIAHEAGASLVVDNTFASPYLQQPLSFGADVVVHSTTKYLGGHSDVVGGALVAASAELGERFAFHQNAIGSVAGPFDSWLVMRGIKTLAVRMDRHCASASRIADVLVHIEPAPL
jgi:cystathionine beta-lyase/cystathionine gamma-synthase